MTIRGIQIGSCLSADEAMNRWLLDNHVNLDDKTRVALAQLMEDTYMKGYSAGRRYGWQQILDTAIDQIHPTGWDYVYTHTPPGTHR